MAHQRARLNISVEHGRNSEKLLFPCLYGFVPHIGNLIIADFIDQHIHNILHIAYDRDFGLNIFADFRGVDIDVNDGGVFAHLMRRGYGSVAESCAANDDQISLV